MCFSLLHSICHKFFFCESCKCDCAGSSCTSSCFKQVVVIGRIDAGAEDHVGTLAVDTPNLGELILRVHSLPKLLPPPIEVSTISRSRFQKEAPEQQKRFVELGLFNIALSHLQFLQQPKNLSPAESLTRLRFAEHLARVNLGIHFIDRDPICTTEKEALDKAVALVKKFGCQAALFWQIATGKLDIDRYPRLKEKALEGLDPVKDRMKKEFFGDLDSDVQDFFFERAKLLTRQLPAYLKDPFIPWIQAAEEVSHDMDDEKETGAAQMAKKTLSNIHDVNALMDAAREEEES